MPMWKGKGEKSFQFKCLWSPCHFGRGRIGTVCRERMVVGEYFRESEQDPASRPRKTSTYGEGY